MSTILCGKRSAIEEIYATPLIKRVRFGNNHSSPKHHSSAASDRTRERLSELLEPFSLNLSLIKGMFPRVGDEIIQKVLVDHAHDLDSAIRILGNLQLEASSQEDRPPQVAAELQSEARVDQRPQVPSPDDRTAWIEVVVREMMAASDVADAQQRAGRVLDTYGAAVAERVQVQQQEAVEGMKQERQHLQSQCQELARENTILKRAVAIQHERQQEHATRAREVEELKHLLVKQQEQLRKLEVNNYALNLHLKTAQQSNSMPNKFHPDVF